jgi:Sulfotransferase family
MNLCARNKLFWVGGALVVFVYCFQLLHLQHRVTQGSDDEVDPLARWDPDAPPRMEMVSASLTHHELRVRNRLYYCDAQGRTVKLARVPDFIIIGTQKGGTTAISGILYRHPLIQQSETFEPHFFDKNAVFKANMDYLDDPDRLCEVRTAYAQENFDLYNLKRHPEVVTFEKTPSYMLQSDLAPYVKKVVPWAKVVVTLRNPIDR